MKNLDALPGRIGIPETVRNLLYARQNQSKGPAPAAGFGDTGHPLDPRVVTNGDIGDMSLLEQPDLQITKEFNKIVDAVIQLSEARAAADLGA